MKERTPLIDKRSRFTFVVSFKKKTYIFLAAYILFLNEVISL